MGHVKQKKSTSTPPEALAIEVVTTKDSAPRSIVREAQRRPAYPEQLNAEVLISQINCRTTSNDSNNNTNNTTTHRTTNQNQSQNQNPNQLCRASSVASVDDVENGPVRRHHRQTPLYRRLISFIRNLWIGAKFNVGKDGKHGTCR